MNKGLEEDILTIAANPKVFSIENVYVISNFPNEMVTNEWEGIYNGFPNN
jgi:hypothetical protein